MKKKGPQESSYNNSLGDLLSSVKPFPEGPAAMLQVWTSGRIMSRVRKAHPVVMSVTLRAVIHLAFPRLVSFDM